MPAHEFGHRMHHHVRAIFDGPQENRRSHGVIDNQRHAMFMRHLGEAFDIRNVARRISHALAINRAGISVDQFFNIVRVIGDRKSAGNALLRQNMSQQRVGCAVKLRRGDDVVAHFRDVYQRVVNRRHSGTDAERVYPAFERGDTLFKHGIGRVADPRVDIALHIQVK